MSRRLPPLNAMRAFEAAARHASFTRAATELCVTQGAVSRHVALLEDWLNIRLFTRERHGVELTAEGASYFRAVKGGLDQIEQGALELQREQAELRLRLKLPPTFAIRWLVPRLARFHALHPKMDVQITTSHQRVDFRREDVDIGIHSDAEPPKGDGYRRLFGEILVPVCAPGLLAREASLAKPRDVRRLTLLSSMNRPLDWPNWFASAGLEFAESDIGLKFENAALAYQAAIDQLGVMIAQLALVADDLSAGRLVTPFALRVPTSGAYYLQHRSGQPRSGRIAVFEEWIVREAQLVDSTG
jgi:LysR family glycine cleavage system transcriptional activator